MQTAFKNVKKDYLATGLSEHEAALRLKEYGPNELKHEKKASLWKLLLSQFGEFMVLLLSAATLASAFMGDYIEAAAIAAIIILNAILGFVQEFRTEKTLEALKKLAAPETLVLRGGVMKRIPATALVPGDVVVLEAGERIPADGVVYEASGLRLDESLLTGESLPISKFKEEKVFMGTMIVNGNGLAVISETGMKTEMGGIASLLQTVEANETPLQERLDKMGKVIAICCVAICVIVVALGVIRGEPLFNMLLSGISLAVAAVPEGMPAIVSVALAIGVRRMLVRNALIRRLPAVETLGCATVICSDKTGTITQNKMVVRKTFVGNKLVEIPEHYKGGINDSGIEKVKELVQLAVLCCNFRKSKKRRGKVEIRSTDPTENAFIDLAHKTGVHFDDLLNDYSRVYEIPFDSDKKRMTVVCKDKKGTLTVIMKGGCDVVLSKCEKVQSAKQAVSINKALSSGVLAMTDSMASDALRVLAVAVKTLNMTEAELNNLSMNGATIDGLNEKIEKGLTFLGMVGMMDPPRKEATASIAKCEKAGIRTVMITGDHKATAVAVAKETGLLKQADPKIFKAAKSDYPVCLTGDEIDQLNDNQFSEMVDHVCVYARVSPRHKLRIVKALKNKGNIVAMTGDGVNDAPAVSEADIGVAMGRDGTDVTREAAAMVLMDDNFATITTAVEEGRVIYSNIKKFIRYLLACNIGEVFSVFVTMLFGFPLPLLPIQVLWINLVTDGLPALALGFDPPAKDVMSQPPRQKEESIFAGGLGYLIFTRGLLIGICTVAVFMFTYWRTGDLVVARTAAFMILVFAQLIHVFECKSEKKTLLGINVFNNIWLILSVLLSFGLTVALVYFEQLHSIFRVSTLPKDIWMFIGLVSLVIPVFGGILTKIYYKIVRK